MPDFDLSITICSWNTQSDLRICLNSLALVRGEASLEVIVLDNLVRGRPGNLAGALAAGKVRLVEGDIRDRELVTSLMTGIDLVFHQAAIRITQCATEPRLALEVLVDGTYEVVEAAVDAGVRKVVIAHTVVSFLFNASILGFAINVTAGLIGGN